MSRCALNQPVTLTYCTNIHPARGLAAVRDSLDSVSVPLKNRVSPDGIFPLGLRLSDKESRELLAPGALDEFRDWLMERGLAVVCLNGFPFGPFHNGRVKDDVHKPDWAAEDRVAYTLRLAQILAELTPTGASAGISTSPLSYKPWGEPIRKMRAQMTHNIARTALGLAVTSCDNQIELHLDIEPEPDGLIATADEFVSWFTEELVPIAAPMLQRNLRLSSSSAADELRRRVAVCLDTCHSAIEFENPADALNTYESAGVRLGRVQVSSALRVEISKDRVSRSELGRSLESFADSVYLHQVVGRFSDGSHVRWPDLPAALLELDKTTADEWRVHFHVPLFIEYIDLGGHSLSTTQRQTRELIRLVRERSLCDLFEIETYTWSVLPTSMQRDLVDSIEREMRWLSGEVAACHSPEGA